MLPLTVYRLFSTAFLLCHWIITEFFTLSNLFPSTSSFACSHCSSNLSVLKGHNLQCGRNSVVYEIDHAKNLSD